jgi:hypothetical protein
MSREQANETAAQPRLRVAVLGPFVPSPGEERGVWSAGIDDDDLVAGSAKLGRWAVSEERGAGRSVVKAVLLGFFDVEVDDVAGGKSAGP